MGILGTINTIANLITAIATVIAAIYAYHAYKHSIKMRKSTSFDAIFTQLISNLQGYMNHATLQKTNINKKAIRQGDVEVCYKSNESLSYHEEYNTFLCFCSIYKAYSKKEHGKKLTQEDINYIWNTYTDSLTYKSNFLNCFKYMYHIVFIVNESQLSEEDKKRYIGIIQSQLNLDILFCYLINLIVARNGAQGYYCSVLKEYYFFKDLFEDNSGYGKLIRNTIDKKIYNNLYKKSTP